MLSPADFPDCDVKCWDMPGLGEQLQITFALDADVRVRGGTVYVPVTATLAEAQARIAAKKAEFVRGCQEREYRVATTTRRGLFLRRLPA